MFDKLGAPDRVKLENYLEDIGEIERRLLLAEKASVEAPDAEVPFGLIRLGVFASAGTAPHVHLLCPE